MAQQLTLRPLGATRSWVVPSTAALVVVVAIAAFGFMAVQGMAFVSPFHSYLDVVSGPTSLALPLLVAMVAGWPVRQHLVDGYIDSTRTRAPLPTTLRRICWKPALQAALLGALVPLSAGLLTLVILPSTGFTYYPDSYYVTQEGLADWTRQAVAGGSLAAASPWLFVLGHTLWVALWCLALGIITQALLLLLERSFLALLMPMVALTLVSVVLAILHLETFTPTASQFPTSLAYFPLWHVVPALLAALALSVALWGRVQRALPEIAGAP